MTRRRLSKCLFYAATDRGDDSDEYSDALSDPGNADDEAAPSKDPPKRARGRPRKQHRAPWLLAHRKGAWLPASAITFALSMLSQQEYEDLVLTRDLMTLLRLHQARTGCIIPLHWRQYFLRCSLDFGAP